MSLIEEALRRLKEPLISTPETPPTSKKAAPQQSAQQDAAPAHSWSTASPATAVPPPPQPMTHALVAVAIAVLALTVVLIVGGTLWMKRTMGTAQPRTAEPSPAISPSPTLPTQGTQPLELTSQPPKTRAGTSPSNQNDLVLSGVVEGLGEPYAVINSMIVRVGEQINDATLISVMNGVVTLRRTDGTDVTLRVPQ